MCRDTIPRVSLCLPGDTKYRISTIICFLKSNAGAAIKRLLPCSITTPRLPALLTVARLRGFHFARVYG